MCWLLVDNEYDNLLTVNLHANNQDWVLDFDRTYHMCPKEFFHNYIEVKGDQILVGNNMVRTIIRIYSVAL